MSTGEKHVSTIVGEVVSNKMQKSIIVLIERKVRHPKYGKYITRSSRICAHDENNQSKIGDIVRVKETKPYSKTKTWVLDEILESNKEQ
jgi:small subunit ribosomal protein S17